MRKVMMFLGIAAFCIASLAADKSATMTVSEVFLFAVGGRVFLLCAHGEGDHTSKQRAAILELLSTAKQP